MTHQEAVETLAAERYLLNELSAADREAFEAHYFSCEECAADLRSTAAMLQGAKEGLAGSETAGSSHSDAAGSHRHSTDRVVSIHRHPMGRGGRAGGNHHVSVGLGGPVTSARRVAGCARASAVAPREPRHRGDGHRWLGGWSRHARARSQRSPAAGHITYDLRPQSGRRILSGRAAAPAPGMPLLLLFPAWTVAGEMHYILTVHDAAAAGRSLGEYRFAVSTR